jgi:hypothetical protein
MFTAPSQPEAAPNKNGGGEGGDEEDERFEILENNVDSTVGDLAHATPPTSASSNQKNTEQPQEEGASS